MDANSAYLCFRLGLVATIKDRANEIYKKVEDQKSSRGRNQDAILAACLYITCRQEDKPRTVISDMRVLMTEDSNNAVSGSFLLDDDSRYIYLAMYRNLDEVSLSTAERNLRPAGDFVSVEIWRKQRYFPAIIFNTSLPGQFS
ncbi:hypothetical protein POM88_046158 [Heracleum sosnowskyi]|uniref:Transcription factor TFIIB cyclin-like domain-containing protein n=1 Tax=Heracleum sosnowskyi TaxID=360622 RepID=A0AAD8M6P9_9APIA|nr:hypothetical protein POM88_046158 [Heracleum sosnowskyi]